jgi:isopropylmalate/homocitrate/citramalate synthase
MAELIYDSVTSRGERPDISSPVGKMCLIYNKMKAEREFLARLAQLQATINPEKVEEAFNNLKNSSFPYMKEIKEKQIKKAKETMMREIKKGPIGLIPIQSPRKLIRRRGK